MHDRQRRDLLRALFWLVCLLPTAAVGAWSFSLRTDRHREAAAERIGSALGMRVTLDAVRYPLPGLTLLEGFRAYDPETDALVLRSCATRSGTLGRRTRTRRLANGSVRRQGIAALRHARTSAEA